MSRITRLLRPETRVSNWKAAIPALALAAMSIGVFAHAAPAKPVEPQSHPKLDFASCAKPQYPKESLAQKHVGTVDLDFLVTADGKVKEAKVAKTSGDPALDEAARSAIALCSFTAARTDGKPVEAWAKVQYVWSLK